MPDVASIQRSLFVRRGTYGGCVRKCPRTVRYIAFPKDDVSPVYFCREHGREINSGYWVLKEIQ